MTKIARTAVRYLISQSHANAPSLDESCFLDIGVAAGGPRSVRSSSPSPALDQSLSMKLGSLAEISPHASMTTFLLVLPLELPTCAKTECEGPSVKDQDAH